MPSIPEEKLLLARLHWGIWPYLSDVPFRETSELLKASAGNTGNLAFSVAIQQQLNMLHPNVAPIQGTHINVLECSNQLGSWANPGCDPSYLRCSNVPLVAIGLGAQADSYDEVTPIHPKVKDWVKAIIEKRSNPEIPNISVRGEFTARVLEENGFHDVSVVLGCPSLFLNRDAQLGQTIAAAAGRKNKRVAVLAGHIDFKILSDIERSLVEIATVTHGAYITQSDLPLLLCARAESNQLGKDDFSKYHNFLLPHFTKEAMIDWWKQHGQVFFNLESWIEYYKHFDFAIGARIHGIVLALQAGIPGICIAHDARTMELCETMRIPHMKREQIQNGISLADLDKRFEMFDPDEFDKNRINLWKQYVDFLTANSIRINDAFKSMFKV